VASRCPHIVPTTQIFDTPDRWPLRLILSDSISCLSLSLRLSTQSNRQRKDVVKLLHLLSCRRQAPHMLPVGEPHVGGELRVAGIHASSLSSTRAADGEPRVADELYTDDLNTGDLCGVELSCRCLAPCGRASIRPSSKKMLC
jgi:hypothetical protein